MKRSVPKILISIIVVFLLCAIIFVVMFHINSTENKVNNAESALEIKAARESDTLEKTLNESARPNNLPPHTETPVLDNLTFRAESYHDGGLLFSITADDFIASYNGLYSADHGESFILPLEEWVCLSRDDSPFSSSETRCYRFQSDAHWLSEPTISIYIPVDSDFVQGITFDYRMHDYTDHGYELFLQECTYAFRVLFPTYEDSEITDLLTELREKADAPGSYTTNFSFIETLPPFLCYKDNIGLFSCFVGQTIHISVVPVTQERVDYLSANQVEILVMP